MGFYPIVLIGKLISGKPAEQAGLLPDDGILSVGGRAIREFTDIRAAIDGCVGKPLDVEVLRAGEVRKLTVVPTIMDGSTIIGIEAKRVVRKVGPLGAFVEGGRATWKVVGQTVWTVKELVSRRISAGTLRGPVGIAEVAGDRARSEGWLALLLGLVPLLSVSVGILNLLPVPPLDGGHMLFLAIEGAIRRDLSPKLKEWILMMGLGLILLLIVFVFYSDLARNKIFGLLGK